MPSIALPQLTPRVPDGVPPMPSRMRLLRYRNYCRACPTEEKKQAKTLVSTIKKRFPGSKERTVAGKTHPKRATLT
jgi:hypothetical protein